MYTVTNFKSKKDLKEAIRTGHRVTVYQPGPFGDSNQLNGSVTLEGPHYPKPHRWYATGKLVDGFLVSVK
jgi:hypothetical protein